MLNIAYTHASVVLVIFIITMLQNKQSNKYSLYSMTSMVVLFAYPIKNKYLSIYMLNIAYTHASVVLVIFDYYMLRTK